MFRLVKPQEIITALFLAFLIIGFLVEENYPSVSMIILGCFIGLIVGSVWTDTTNKWLLMRGNALTSSNYINVEGITYNRKNIFYIWFIFKLIYVSFLFLGAYLAMYFFVLFANTSEGYSWYLKLFFSIAYGLVAMITSIAPLLIFEFLDKKLKNKFVLKYKSLFKELEKA